MSRQEPASNRAEGGSSQALYLAELLAHTLESMSYENEERDLTTSDSETRLPVWR